MWVSQRLTTDFVMFRLSNIKTELLSSDLTRYRTAGRLPGDRPREEAVDSVRANEPTVIPYEGQ